MEKDKGIFSFRKHPVGELLGGKKERKRKMHRALGMLLAAALIVGTLPASGLAVSASGREAGLCEHHRSHTPDCGYREAQPCTHEHGEECYRTVTECVHEHTDGCYPETEESTGEGSAIDSDAGSREPSKCTHECSEESGCITKVLDCHHEHDESCGYQEAQECGYVCEICNGTEPENIENNAENAGTDMAECICETLCTEDSINGDCPVCGAEDADLSRCKGEKTEEQDKTGEKVITAWEWIDPEGYLTDGMLALPGAGRENPAFAEDVTALLPEKIQAKVAAVTAAEDGEETEEDAETAPETEDAEITLTGWECASYPEDGAYEGTYTFTASLPEGFVLAEDAAGLEVKVELGGVEMLAETVSVSYQEASWNGSEVTYTGKTENCTSVESSTNAVTWNAGWYVVSGTVTITEPITVTGAVNLILADGCTLNAEKGIVVTTDNSLTIYAQSGGTGTLNATGTTDSSNNASAGIGGSTTIFDSGSITIHGGVINATGGSTGSSGYGGAGIGGGTPNYGNGGSSGAITIYGGTVTANGGAGAVTGAGIGGGGGLTGGGAGNNIQIYGGTVNATGGTKGAGIGGGGSGTIAGSSYKSGNGTGITISGGSVTAVGGNYAAGIGGGGGYYYSNQYSSGGCAGGTGSVTISGGIVDASSPTDVYYSDYKGAPIGNGGNTGDTAATVNRTNAIVFENGEGTVCGDVTFDGSYTLPADYTLNIPAGASLSGSGTLSGGSAFTTENLTENMISVPTDLYYTGKDRTEDLKTRLSDELNTGIELFGQTFTVSGWTLAVEKTGDLTYTATYTNNNDSANTFTKTITLLKSGTKFEGDVKTYNGNTQTTTFSADDTVTVKAVPTATGMAPQKAAARLRGEPGAGQMALYVGDLLVSSEAANADTDGTYTMTVSASDVLTLGGVEPNGDPISLTAKFVGNDNMADGAGTVDVNISAAAKVEKGGAVTGYYGESNLADAFADSGNAGATFTMLSDVEQRTYLDIQIDCTLDLGGHTITSPLGRGLCVRVQPSTTVTIRGEGEIIAKGGIALEVNGSVTLEGGTYTSGENESSSVYVMGQNAMLSVTGEKVAIRNTSGGYGLSVAQAQSVRLSAGTYSGTTEAISSSVKLSDMLAHMGDTRYAYYQNDALVTTGLDGQALTGTVTVKACTHAYQYAHTTGTTTHSQTCLACGDKKTTETCSYVDGKCACGSTLSVTLTDTEKRVYSGSPHTPDVTVTLDGTELTAAGYDVTYADNVNAGTDTATVTVTGKGSYNFEIKKTFSIEKAEQKDFAVVAETKPYEKNGTFTLSTTGGGGDGAVLYRVPENNGVLMVNGNTAVIIGVGTVTVTAAKAESDNYKAVTATGNITIKKASAPAITYPTAGSITYGQKLSDCALTGGSTEYGTFAWKDASTVPVVGDTTDYAVAFTVSEETKKNYETITNTTQNVPVKVEKAVPAVSIKAALSGSKDSRQAVITVNVAKAGAGAFPTGTVTFINCTGSTEVEIGTATLSNGTASYTWDGITDQTYTIKVVYAGNSNYMETESRELTFDAAKQNQQDFALDAIGAKTYGDAAVILKTTGGSGNGAVRYESSDEDVIRIENGRAVITGAGTAVITAIKEEDDNYNEASASRNVTVAKKALTVKADSKTVVRGNPMPVFTYRTNGLVNGDTFTTDPSITAGAQNTDTLGKYDIVISGGTLQNSENYRITYVNGTLNIVERFYTVTVTDGTGGGEYAEGDTVTVTANERNGYTFTGWSSEDGAAFADSKAKTTTFTMPARSVAVKANYTRNNSGGNNSGGSGNGGNSDGPGNNGGGNSGGNEDNGGSGGNDEGQGSGGNGSTNPGNGNTAPRPSVIPPIDTGAGTGNETAPGTGTTPAGPGSGNTSRQGTAPGSGSAGIPAQGLKQPFIKGADGKIGWDVIRAEEEQAQEGSIINVDMNGSTVVPGDIFDSIKGKDITVTFDMGSGILWSVNGKEVITDKAGDIDFSVKAETNAIPVDIVNNVTGERYSIQISLAYDGEFGFTAVLSIDLGRENAGYTASLYYYNESAGELEFICSDEIAEDGTVSLAFTHASDYVIAIDGDEESGSAAEPAQPEKQDGDSTIPAGENPQAVQAWRPWWIIVAGALVIIVGIGVFFVVKKKQEDENSGQ